MSLRFVQITDHHLCAGDLLWGYSTGHALRAVLRHIAAHAGPVDFIVSTGDLTEHGTDEEYRAFLELVGAAPAAAPGPLVATAEGLGGVPLYVLPGNHDVRPALLAALYPGAPPAERIGWAFERGGVRFIALDWGPRGKAESTPELFAQLAAGLADGAPSVLFTHHHVVPTGCGWLDALLADDLDRFAAQIAGRGVMAICSGHAHTSYAGALGGVPVYGLRSTCFQFVLDAAQPLRCLLPPHYRIVTIADGALSTEIVEVPL